MRHGSVIYFALGLIDPGTAERKGDILRMKKDEMSLEALWEYLQLRTDDTVIGAGADINFNAVVFPVPLLSNYVSAYYEAAESFVNALEDNAIYMRDYFVYPFIQLYFHSIELHLKHLIILGCIALGRDPSDIDLAGRQGHDISWLWENLRGILEELRFDEQRELDLLENILRVFDRNIFTVSRHPFDTRGRPLSFQEQRINLLTLRDAMARVNFALTGWCEAIHQQTGSNEGQRD
jgi:hypothetical protein